MYVLIPEQMKVDRTISRVSFSPFTKLQRSKCYLSTKWFSSASQLVLFTPILIRENATVLRKIIQNDFFGLPCLEKMRFLRIIFILIRLYSEILTIWWKLNQYMFSKILKIIRIFISEKESFFKWPACFDYSTCMKLISKDFAF